MTVILPGDGDFPSGSVQRAEDRTHGNRSDTGERDFGETLVQPIPAVRTAAEQCRVDCALQDATRAFDAFTHTLASEDTGIDKWPARFTDEARRLRDRFVADIPDGPARDRFDAGFDLFAKAKAVETRGLATHRRIAANRAELQRILAGYGETISRAMNPVSVEFALKQGEEAIRNQVDARVLSEDEGQELSRRYRTDIALRQAQQFMADAPDEAAEELEKTKGGLFADLDRGERKRLAAQARLAAAVQKSEAARLAEVKARRNSAEKALRRDTFLQYLDERAERGDATLADITAATREGVIETDEAVARMQTLENTFAERDLHTARVAEVMKRPDTFLDPDNGEDRRSADIYWQETVSPLVRNLPAAERIRLEDAVVRNTGIAPKSLVDGVLAGLLSGDPASRFAAARRVQGWLRADPPIPVDRLGLRIPEFEALQPYLDLPVPDVRKIELAERAEPVMRRTVGERKRDAEGEVTSSDGANPVSDAGGDNKPAPFSPGEAQDRLDEKLSDPETRAALREQLLKGLEEESERSNLSPAEVLERQQQIREALPADPAKATQVAIAPAIAAGAAAAISPQALASALAVIGLGGLVAGDTNDAGTTTADSVSKRVEEDGDRGRGRGGDRADGDSPSDGTPAGDPGDEPPERERTGRKARNSSKNERHGDGGRALTKQEERLKELEEKIRTAPRKERQKLKKRLKNIREDAEKKRSGTEDSRSGKRP